MSKKIYVILTQTGTVPAKIIKFITKAPYNHTSITSDEGLYEIYSFCRKFKRTPIPAGFVNESDVGVFEMFNNVPCEVYSFDVTEKKLNRVFAYTTAQSGSGVSEVLCVAFFQESDVSLIYAVLLRRFL